MKGTNHCVAQDWFAKHLGIEVVEYGAGWVRTRLEITCRPCMVNRSHLGRTPWPRRAKSPTSSNPARKPPMWAA